MSAEDRLRGKRYIALARCSTNDQAETSLPGQLTLLRSFGDRHGMIYVDEIARDVTGSLPGARTEFAELIQRKTEKDDFDSVLVQDATRLTRSGVQHAFSIKEKLEEVGIEIVYASDHRPEGDFAEIIEAVEHSAGKLYSKKLSHAVARGLMRSLEQGRIPHTLCVPYGIDRLYETLDGRPLHVIRNLPDGTQVKLDPTTLEVIEKYPVGCRLHYRQQSNEKVVLIRGEKERQDIIRLIFSRRLVDGWAGFRIARELNQLGYRSCKGRAWSVSSVRNILWNTVYTGIGVANRKTYARYSCRAHAEPKAIELDKRLLKKKKLPGRLRPPSDWIKIEHSHLRDYLGALRDMAVEWQRAEWAKHANPVPNKKRGGDSHAGSSYFLKGILRSKEGGHALSGRCGMNGRLGMNGQKTIHRYYAIHRGFTVPVGGDDKHMRRLIPATELERVVVGQLRDVLLQTPDLREVIEKTIRAELKRRASPDDEFKRLEGRRKSLGRQIDVVLDSLTDVGRDAAKERLQRIESELTEVTARLAQLKADGERQVSDPSKLAEEIVSKLHDLGERLDQLPKETLRRLLSLFVARLDVEMRTKNLEVEFALPSWAVLAAMPKDDVRLAAQSVHASGYQANMENMENKQIIAAYSCRGFDRRHLRMTTCFECERRKAA